jgi:hypothetical protein
MKKVCNGCQKEFELSEFPKCSGKCRSCKAQYTSDYRRKNKVAINARQREWLRSRPGYAKNRLESNPTLAAKRKKLEADRWQRTKSGNPNVGKERYRENREQILALSRKYNKENRAELNKRLHRYRKNNPESVALANHNRRAAENRSRWDIELDAFALSEAERLKKLRLNATGIKWHLDHIEPLHGEDVSGLHNAFNFAVVPASFNCMKRNKRLEFHWVRYV